MKKIYTMITVALLAVTISASAQQVILRFNENYEVNIDGRKYTSNETVPVLNYGKHSVELYRVQPGFLGIGKKRTLLSSSNFELRNNDVIIEVDQNERLRINDLGNSANQKRSSKSNSNGDYSKQQKNGRGYGPYDNPGRGHKYGLYKKDRDRSDNDDQGEDHDKKDKKFKKDKKDKYEKQDKQYKNDIHNNDND